MQGALDLPGAPTGDEVGDEGCGGHGPSNTQYNRRRIRMK